MALGYTEGSGKTIASDQRNSEHMQIMKDGGHDSLQSGRQIVTTAGTKVQLSVTPVPCKRVDICAETDNTGIIVVGGTLVVAALGTRAGIPLNPGEFISMGVADLNLVWIDSTVSTDGVTYNYYV